VINYKCLIKNHNCENSYSYEFSYLKDFKIVNHCADGIQDVTFLTGDLFCYKRWVLNDRVVVALLEIMHIINDE
jgi:hypothetical protein